MFFTYALQRFNVIKEFNSRFPKKNAIYMRVRRCF